MITFRRLVLLTSPGRSFSLLFFFFNDTATTEIYTLSLHDALPIYLWMRLIHADLLHGEHFIEQMPDVRAGDRKSTRLNSSHTVISYAVFCLKKKKKTKQNTVRMSNRVWMSCRDLPVKA